MQPNAENKPISFCVIGNVMLDIVTSLHHIQITEAGRFPTLRNPISIFVGGTGVITALGASEKGFSPVSIIGKIGVTPPSNQPDTAGKLIIDALTNGKVNIHFSQDKQRPTGMTMITYFDQDARLLVADRGANDSFSLEDVTSDLLAVVAQSDILFVSGFMLVSPSQAQTVMRLIQEANAHHRLVVLDVVPHSIYKSVDSPTFREYTKLVNVLISETATLRHLFPAIQPLDQETQMDAIATCLLEHYNAIILRPSNAFQHVYDRQGIIMEGVTGYNENDREGQRGYLDLLAIQVLYDHFERFSDAL